MFYMLLSFCFSQTHEHPRSTRRKQLVNKLLHLQPIAINVSSTSTYAEQREKRGRETEGRKKLKNEWNVTHHSRKRVAVTAYPEEDHDECSLHCRVSRHIVCPEWHVQAFAFGSDGRLAHSGVISSPLVCGISCVR